MLSEISSPNASFTKSIIFSLLLMALRAHSYFLICRCCRFVRIYWPFIRKDLSVLRIRKHHVWGIRAYVTNDRSSVFHDLFSFIIDLFKHIFDGAVVCMPNGNMFLRDRYPNIVKDSHGSYLISSYLIRFVCSPMCSLHIGIL